MGKQNESSIFGSIGLVVSGPITVFLSGWIIFIVFKLLEKLYQTLAVVEEDAESVTYDGAYAIIWKILSFLNGRVMGPVVNLVLILLIGVLILSGLETKRRRLYFGISFMGSYALYIFIIIGIF